MDKGNVYIHNEIYEYSHKKGNPDVCDVNIESIMLSETEKRQVLYEITYMWNLKKKS